MLGNPATCPHGHPIPSTDLTDPERPGVPLAQLSAGDVATVHGVTEEMSEMLRYLGEIGLRPGAGITVLEKAPLGGPVTIRVNDTPRAISLELARLVTVLPTAAPSPTA